MDAQVELLDHGTTRITPISARCYFRDEDDVRVVFVMGIPVFRYDTNDKVTEKFVIVSLVDDGFARQVAAAEAFGIDAATVRRWQARYRKKGIRGLARKLRRSALLKMGGAMDRAVRRMFTEGESAARIAHRLGVGKTTIKCTLRRLGLKRESGQDIQMELEEVAEGLAGEERVAAVEEGEAESEVAEEPASASELEEVGEVGEQDEDEEGPETTSSERRGRSVEQGINDLCIDVASEAGSAAEEERVENDQEDGGTDESARSLDLDPTDRRFDRALGRKGVLEDALPLFAPGKDVAGAGVLLAIPVIVDSGVLEVFRQLYGSLGAGFYGLRTVVTTLLFMALSRIKRPENLKEHSPRELGKMLGLDRAPEVKTLREKLGIMAKMRKAAQLMREVARKRMKARQDVIGFLYVDGHVREYHGNGKLGKAYVTRRRLAARAQTDTWVNDGGGDPLFVVASQVNAGLTKMLEPVVDEVQAILGKDRRLTVVFDRGGWSPKLFARLIERGIDILTYRKGKQDAVDGSDFQEMTATVEGKKVTYELHEMSVQMGKTTVRTEEGKKRPLWMRQVTRLREDGERQTQVLTTRQDLGAVEVLWRMFNRWRQENFFKYMRQEYALDALVDYNLESVSPELDRPNPARTAIEKELRKAQQAVKKLESEYGAAALDNQESQRRTIRGFKIANGKIGKALRGARERVEKLKAQRNALPERVPADTLERLSTERKLITDILKMTAYQIENDMVRMVWDHFARAPKEGHKLIVAALKSAAEIEVTDSELRVTLAPQSSPQRSRAIAALCDQLNAMNANYPGTNLQLRYGITCE